MFCLFFWWTAEERLLFFFCLEERYSRNRDAEEMLRKLRAHFLLFLFCAKNERIWMAISVFLCKILVKRPFHLQQRVARSCGIFFQKKNIKKRRKKRHVFGRKRKKKYAPLFAFAREKEKEKEERNEKLSEPHFFSMPFLQYFFYFFIFLNYKGLL